jgi:hypothetical protein
MNFWATGLRVFWEVLVCSLISVVSLYTESTKKTARLSSLFFCPADPKLIAFAEAADGLGRPSLHGGVVGPAF